MNTTEKQRAELRELADDATNGPWETDGGIIAGVYVPGESEYIGRCVPGEKMWDNAEFIAAANPSTIKDLLADIDELQARIDALMFEFCPQEMTDKQKQRWADSQVKAKS